MFHTDCVLMYSILNPTIFFVSLIILFIVNIFDMKISGSFLSLQKCSCYYYVITLLQNHTPYVTCCLALEKLPAFKSINLSCCICSDASGHICLVAFCQELVCNFLLIELGPSKMVSYCFRLQGHRLTNCFSMPF